MQPSLAQTPLPRTSYYRSRIFMVMAEVMVIVIVRIRIRMRLKDYKKECEVEQNMVNGNE